MSEAREQIEVNGIQYSPVTFEEFASHTKYSLFGVPRYRWSGKAVAILGTFSTRKLSYTRNDFARFDRTMGPYAHLKPPSGGDAGPSIALGPAFDDGAWSACKREWEAFSAQNGAVDSVPRFHFLGTIIFDKKVFRSHYLALDTILFANSHSGDPVLPDVLSLTAGKGRGARVEDVEGGASASSETTSVSLNPSGA
jgi:hypothetical protein